MALTNTLAEDKSRSWLKPADQLDLWLDSLGLYRKHTARDSSCLFRAISEQVFLTQVHHDDVRRQILDYMLRHPSFFQNKLEEMESEEDVISHVGRLRNQREWGGVLELHAIARYFRSDVYVRVGQEGEEEVRYGFPRRLMLCLTQERHYDSLYSKNYINHSAFCQAVLYEVLYKEVFRLEEVDYAVTRMLHDKTAKLPRDHLALYSPGLEDERLELRDRCTNVKELLELGITPFPYKVAKALDTEIYRNVEFDIWNDYRKGLRYGLCSWNCKDIQVGVKCLVKTPEGQVYQGHVQEMQPNKGPVLVYVLQLGQKITVPYDWLEVVIPPSPPVPTPTKTSDRPLSDLFGKIKEAAARKNIIQGSKEQIQPPMTREGFVESASSSTYQPYPYQEGGSAAASEEVIYPDSTKQGDEAVYYVDEGDEKTLLAQRSDPLEVPNTDVNAMRFFYNLGLEHMRMNCLMRPCYVGLPSVCLPLEATPPVDSHPGGEAMEMLDEAQQPGAARLTKRPKQTTPDRRNSQVYEGAPLIQQYEVSSTTGVTSLPVQPQAPPPPLYYQPVEVESMAQYCPPPAALYLPADYPAPLYDYTAAMPAFQPLPPFQYLPAAEPPLYYLPHLPQSHP